MNRANTNAIIQHYGKRWEQVEFMQIPHHGAATSWHPGISKRCRHKYSVFSSKRKSKKHPGETVVKDLKNRGPVFVNEYQGAFWSGAFIW